MAQKLLSIASQSISTALVSFDFSGLGGFSRGLFFALRANDHLVTIKPRLVVGTTSLVLTDAVFNETINALNPLCFPIFQDTLRIDVQRVSGAAATFQGLLVVDDKPFDRPLPCVIGYGRVTVAAGGTSSAFTDRHTTLHSKLSLGVTFQRAGRLRVNFTKPTADVGPIEVCILAAAGSAYVEMPVLGAEFDLTLVNDDGGLTNSTDWIVTAQP